MKALLLFMTTIMLSLFCSCDKNKTETELDGLASNSIHLSTRELKFDSSSSIKEVTTEGNRWMIYIITNEDTDLDYSEDNIVMTMGDIGKNENTPLKIEGDWFTLKK